MKTNNKGKKKGHGSTTLLAHTLGQFFQCGDLKDVSEFMTVSTHQTAVKTRRRHGKKEGSDNHSADDSSNKILPSNSTSTTTVQSSTCTQTNMSSSSASSSSSTTTATASSPFMIPSRKSMEDLLRTQKPRKSSYSSQSPGSSLLYCGAFDWATTTTSNPTNTTTRKNDDMESNLEMDSNLDGASIFSRTATGPFDRTTTRATTTIMTRTTPNRLGKSMVMKLDGDRPCYQMDISPTISQQTTRKYQMNQACELWSVGSDR